MLLASAATGSLLVGTLIVGAACAADLPASAPVYKATPMAPGFSWAGFYVGIEGGGAWGRSKQTSGNGDVTNGFDLDGGLVGGEYGTNWQFGHWVLGLESDASWVSLRGTTPELVPPSAPGFTASTTQDYLGTNRGRIGYAQDRWLVFATGGEADTLVQATSSGPIGSISETKYRMGWTGGGGVEWAFAPQWSAKLEYLYTDFGSHMAYLNPVPTGFTNRAGGVSLNENIVRVGINYHYDLPGLLLKTVFGNH
jgi:outer membrane immunogenic protein